ncbi:23S rRNA (guanosine(2251)-2'-O)-methyltransferase RlmB [Eubacteriales bacterium OttesenSCG-928-N14]|nr:23S rRNA (guanosine(2251)-2'-O)-methyltransferase RlmB [Eubacteriales bacterium OttesenSCG-928-N14]
MEETTMILYGINPVREAIRAGQPIERGYVSKRQGQAASVAMQLKQMGVPVVDVDEARMLEICRNEDGREPNHQGIAVVIGAVEYASVEDMLQTAAERGQMPLLLVLDGITDTNNLGAIIRSAEALGAHGVILPKRRSAGLSGAVARASSGAISNLPIARVANLVSQIESLKQKNIWIAGATMDGMDATKADLNCPLCICIGSEGEGLSRLLKEHCDFTVGIPLLGRTESLNASVAAGILLYEAVRQRRG